MTPAEFAEVVVVPTVRDFLADRGNRRIAYLACIATYHLVDHISHAEGSKKSDAVFSTMKAACGPSFEVVHGICTGTKHPRSNAASRFPAGAETIIDFTKTHSEPLVPLGTIVLAARGSEHLGPLLSVPHGGELRTVDFCVMVVLNAFVRTYPKHLGTVDLSFLDPP